MNSILKKIWKASLIWTFSLCLLCMVLVWLLWPEDSAVMAALGVFMGALIGLAGLVMIIWLTMSFTADPGADQKKGALGYTGRYVFYAIALFGLAYLGVPALAMLLGILCSKASLVIYAYQNRKDNE